MSKPQENIDRDSILIVQDGVARIKEKGRLLVKDKGRQVAIFANGDTYFACNNRCPHEGYPLIEASMDTGATDGDVKEAKSCIITCNWHNWKFDLSDGTNLMEGDNVRVYPTEVRGDDILVDISGPSKDVQIQTALDNLHGSFARHEYGRMAREIARLHKAGADMDLAVKKSLLWVNDQLEYGMTHAHAATAEWLILYDIQKDKDRARALAAITESVGHLAWDTQREDDYPYADAAKQYEPEVLKAAIEDEKEQVASSQIKAAFAEGLGFKDLEPLIAEAVFSHYRDFGHSAIYLEKTRSLIERFGSEVELPMLLSYVRAVVVSWREDEIPEFKNYAPSLIEWGAGGDKPITGPEMVGLSVNAALKKCLESAKRSPLEIYDALVYGLSWNLLHFEESYGQRADLPVSKNITWLRFTHGLTFANAVRKICERYPRYWPQGLLQLACFLGRNTKFTDQDINGNAWEVDDSTAFFDAQYEKMFDHGQSEYIVISHLLKTLRAVEEEVSHQPKAEYVGLMQAGLNRFLNSQLKGKHVLRSANQALALVDMED